jgi:hypothetical protein
VINRTYRSLFLAAVAALGSASAAHATVIGLNFASGEDFADGVTVTSLNYDLLPADSAGVVPSANWNNLHLANASINNTGGATNVVDSTGAATTADVVFQTNGTWDTGGPLTNGNFKMMRAHLDGRASFFVSPADPTVTVSSIPYSTYDVYVYFDAVTSDGSVNSNYTIGSQTFFIKDTSTFNGTTFVQGTGTTSGTRTSGANYVLFSGLSGASFTMTADSETFRAEVSGMQIVDTTVIPAPAALPAGLALLGGMALKRRRK